MASERYFPGARVQGKSNAANRKKITVETIQFKAHLIKTEKKKTYIDALDEASKVYGFKNYADALARIK